MAALIVVIVKEGDPFSYRLVEGESVVQFTLAEANVNLSVRSLVALHQMTGDAIEAKRAEIGEEWAELFPPELDLGVAPAAYLFSGPEGSWATRVREVAGDGVPVLDCHVNNGVDAVRSMLSRTGPVVLDGVHMLSAAAANALFIALNGRSSSPIILTTTDPAKVLPTIRGCCQHENTGRMAA